MGIKDGTFEFELSRPLEFKFNGSTESTTKIVLHEMGMEHWKLSERLKQIISGCEVELYERFGKEEAEGGEVVKSLPAQVKKIESQFEETYNQIRTSLSVSGNANIMSFLTVFEKMVLMPANQVICRVDGKVNMTSALWSNLYPPDATEMAHRWCAFFAMPSEEGLKKESEPQPESASQRMEA